MTKKFGFTLAEVLITLGIIGVVAAMTLPTLVSNYKKQTYVTQLKKTVSTLEQGFQKMRADAGGVDKLEDTEPYIKMRTNSEHGECPFGSFLVDPACTQFYEDLKQYFNFVNLVECENYIIKFRNSNEGDDITGDNFMIFTDGAMVSLDTTYVSEEESTFMNLDINGYKAPNTYGYDVFRFKVTPNGKLIDYKNADNCRTSDGASSADGCYSYLARNGWKMDY